MTYRRISIWELSEDTFNKYEGNTNFWRGLSTCSYYILLMGKDNQLPERMIRLYCDEVTDHAGLPNPTDKQIYSDLDILVKAGLVVEIRT